MRARVHSSSSLLPHSSRDAGKFILHSRPRRVDHKPLSITVDQSHFLFLPSSCSLCLSLFPPFYFDFFYVLVLDVSCVLNGYQSPRTSFIYSRLFRLHSAELLYPNDRICAGSPRSRLKIYFCIDLRDNSRNLHEKLTEIINAKLLNRESRSFIDSPFPLDIRSRIRKVIFRSAIGQPRAFYSPINV